MKSLKTPAFVGTTLTIIGSFLPWERSGGFADFPINGIRVDIANFKYWVRAFMNFQFTTALVHKSKSRHNSSLWEPGSCNQIAFRHAQMGHTVEC